jgi:hypothetical protein
VRTGDLCPRLLRSVEIGEVRRSDDGLDAGVVRYEAARVMDVQLNPECTYSKLSSLVVAQLSRD